MNPYIDRIAKIANNLTHVEYAIGPRDITLIVGGRAVVLNPGDTLDIDVKSIIELAYEKGNRRCRAKANNIAIQGGPLAVRLLVDAAVSKQLCCCCSFQS